MNNYTLSYNALKTKQAPNKLMSLLIVTAVVVVSLVAYLLIQPVLEKADYQTQKAVAAEVTEVIREAEEPVVGDVSVARLPVIEDIIKSDVALNVPTHIQERGLSCEVAALKMALMYKGVNVSENELMVHVGYDSTPHSGDTWGNPHQAFVGDIDGRQPTTGYGVYWEPIARAASNYRQAEYFVNGTVQKLVEEILNGNPVVVWGNAASGRRVDWYAPNGELIKAISGEHTLTVKGFYGPQDNPTHIVYNDPHSGEVVQEVEDFNYQWSLLDYAGVVIR